MINRIIKTKIKRNNTTIRRKIMKANKKTKAKKIMITKIFWMIKKNKQSKLPPRKENLLKKRFRLIRTCKCHD